MSSTSLSPTAFSFTAAATAQLYTLSLHDALPISAFFDACRVGVVPRAGLGCCQHDPIPRGLSRARDRPRGIGDRKSTRLNSSHVSISYAVFCLKKKNKRSLQA